MTRNIALDGPLNGLYIDPEQAEQNGYTLSPWSDREDAWIHSKTVIESLSTDGVPIEFEEDEYRDVH